MVEEKYIMLECGHVFEVYGLSNYIDQSFACGHGESDAVIIKALIWYSLLKKTKKK